MFTLNIDQLLNKGNHNKNLNNILHYQLNKNK